MLPPLEKRRRADPPPMKVVTDPATLLLNRLLRLLRWRVWVQERLQPSEWQVTLFWAAVAGFLGALSAILFTTLTERVQYLKSWQGQLVSETGWSNEEVDPIAQACEGFSFAYLFCEKTRKST